VNTGNTSINLSKVTLRYYYTEDGTQAQTFWCDWSTAGNDHVTGKFMKLAASKEGADHYLEIGFSSEAGTLAPNSSVEVQARFSKNDWSNYNQDDDYSFSPSSSSYADWEKVPAYLSGTLVWGQEPGE
jgi:mannan endo-1,4-beta-mannosidase